MTQIEVTAEMFDQALAQYWVDYLNQMLATDPAETRGLFYYRIASDKLRTIPGIGTLMNSAIPQHRMNLLGVINGMFAMVNLPKLGRVGAIAAIYDNGLLIKFVLSNADNLQDFIVAERHDSHQQSFRTGSI